MRQQGASYGDIEKAIGINRSTLSYILRNVKLSPAKKARLQAKTAERRALFIKTFAVPGIATESQKRGGQSAWKKHQDLSLKNLQSSFTRHTAPELLLKARLEKLYKCTFKKEKIGRVLCPYASDALLILITNDYARGTGLLVKKLMAIEADPRLKIVYIDTRAVSHIRQARLEALSNEVRDFRQIWEENEVPPFVPRVRLLSARQ